MSLQPGSHGLCPSSGTSAVQEANLNSDLGGVAKTNKQKTQEASKNLRILQCDHVWLAGLWEHGVLISGRFRGRVKPCHMTLEFLQMPCQEERIEQE